MDYEVVKPSDVTNGVEVNFVCPDICPDVDVVCPDIGCGQVDSTCNVDSACDGNSFPCENPGFGCRHGCGGANATNCATTQST